jgi:hypothetical protein
MAAAFYVIGLTAGAVMVAVMLRRAIAQRRGFQQFAPTHGLKFVGTRVSDAQLPFTAFEQVRSAVLLCNVVEGAWQGVPLTLFEFNASRGGNRWTAVIAETPASAVRMRINPSETFGADLAAKTDERRGWTPLDVSDRVAGKVMTAEQVDAAVKALGPRVSAVLASGPLVSLELHFGYLYVTARRRLTAAELPAFLAFVVSVCRALEADVARR